MINAFYVLRSPLLGSLIKIANEQLNQIFQGLDATSAAVEPLEATIFCITAIQEAVPEDDTQLAQLCEGPLFVAMESATGPNGIRMQQTSLKLIGRQHASSRRLYNRRANGFIKLFTHLGSSATRPTSSPL